MPHDTSVISKNHAYVTNKSMLLKEIMEGNFREAVITLSEDRHFSPTPDLIADIFNDITKTSTISTLPVEFASFCLEFARVHREKIDVFPDAERGEDILIPKIAYLQNAFSNRGYNSFSRLFGKVTTAYFSSFREVCEEVYYGRASHAILPIFSTNDGPLISFRKLISKYDLKITTATDVDMNDDSVMRFALLKKGLSLNTAPSFLDLSVNLPDTVSIGAFLTACDQLGMKTITINSYPLDYSSDRCGLSAQFDVSRGDLAALTLFLEGSHIPYEVIGLYEILDRLIL